VTARRCPALVRLAASRYGRAAGAALAGAAAGLAGPGPGFDPGPAASWAAAARSVASGSGARSASEWNVLWLCSRSWDLRAGQNTRRRSWHGSAAASLRCRERSRRAERDVVQLAARGLTSKEIAQQLSITVHTVKAHLCRAYGKLGVRSRSQFAAQLTSRPRT